MNKQQLIVYQLFISSQYQEHHRLLHNTSQLIKQQLTVDTFLSAAPRPQHQEHHRFLHNTPADKAAADHSHLFISCLSAASIRNIF